MSPAYIRRFLLACATGAALAACSSTSQTPMTIPLGGSQPQAAQAPVSQPNTTATTSLGAMSTATATATTVTTSHLTLEGGEAATLSISSSAAAKGTALEVGAGPKAVVRAQSDTRAASSTSCSAYVPPAIDITNPFSQPIVLSYRDLQALSILIVVTQCNVAGQGFNVALAEVKPATTMPVTIGDVKGVSLPHGVSAVSGFMPRTNASYTLAPKSTTQISFVPAQVDPATGYPYANSQVTNFPPNMPTTLGSVPTASCASSNGASPSPGCPNGADTQTTVSVTPQTSSGGSASVSCFGPTDPRYALIPPANIAAFPGTVKGACEFDSGSSTVTLGTTVTFTIANPDPDAAHGLLEGPIVQIPCTQTTNGNAITATCPTTGPTGSGFTIGSNTQTQYMYFLFGNDPNPTGTSNVSLSPSWVSVAAGTPSNGYTFALPTFATYPVTLTIDGDVNQNLSIADSNPIPCGNFATDMTQVSPGSLRVNCATGHAQGIIMSYTGGTWQYQHNGVAGQNQDCDASCVAYASIDLYDATGKTLLQGDGPGATINGTSTGLATVDPIAIIDPATGALEDANAQTVNLPEADADPTNNTATVLKVTEANLNALNSTNITFGLRQPTNGDEVGLNIYFGGSSFVTSGSPTLPVGSQTGLAHVPYGVGLDIQSNQIGGNPAELFITPPEPAGQHAPPSAIVTVNIPSPGQSIETIRRRH